MFSLNDLWDATFQLLEKWHRIAVKNKLINISPNFSSSFLFIENFLSFSQFSLSFSLIFRLIHTCSNPSLTYPHNLILFTGINQSVVYDHNAFSFIHTRFLLSYHFTHTLYEAFQSFMTMFYFFSLSPSSHYYYYYFYCYSFSCFTRDFFYYFFSSFSGMCERSESAWRVANFLPHILLSFIHMMIKSKNGCERMKKFMCKFFEII